MVIDPPIASREIVCQARLRRLMGGRGHHSQWTEYPVGHVGLVADATQSLDHQPRETRWRGQRAHDVRSPSAPPIRRGIQEKLDDLLEDGRIHVLLDELAFAFPDDQADGTQDRKMS
jgi:hypothetical protein